VSKINRLAEHEWAASNDGLNAPLLAFANRFLRHAAAAKRAMEPHVAYAALSTLPYDFNCSIGVGGHDDSIDGSR
jgi:hypothetical protein